ncbi:hypothetical protein IRY55_05730 [Savagea sp. SN6]|uniref:Uncharacterized protein n=1 Tax=Savagea serpentis TaxID=2785297 RepID=A0A8J7KE59_9BACL|nr:hypothetical protein [Savagea serpentis]MBF4500861.1 hypothetical protein [Savagea serpentis]
MKFKSMIPALILLLAVVCMPSLASASEPAIDTTTENTVTLTATAVGLIGSLIILPTLMFLYRD